MALGMEVGFCPGHIVLDGDPAPHPEKGGGESRTWTEVGLEPRRHCVRRGPSA